MNKLEGLTALGRAWLDELNLIHRLEDDATEDERRKLITRANEEAAKVEAQLEGLRRTGALKAMNQEFKRHREEHGKRAMTWPAYALARKERMVRALAREQAYRNRWRTP